MPDFYDIVVFEVAWGSVDRKIFTSAGQELKLRRE
jgi:hypothetical protein